VRLKVNGRPDWRDFDVYLNGVKLKDVVEVDDEAGWFIRWVRDSKGAIKFNRATELVETERIEISKGSKLKIIKRGS
jgi:hypothetical protein